ncbi:MAG: hypothetical protein U0L91_07315 [Gemmiger sp.]|uniref:hypothetical protein n=1 Tax=Gemmiger sp. TaxID=2049027 RepID=UPI002E7A3FB9|nr:hypothetical protein [Gemmiger sp.]MEE0801072.1 hypothetical protein [Gemmiger sp.]
MRFCRECGLLAPLGSDQVCPRCGAPLPPPVRLRSRRPEPRYLEPEDPPPMTTGQYFLTLVVCGIPVVGLIVLCVWAAGHTILPERCRLARAYLIRRLLTDIVLLLLLWLLRTAWPLLVPTWYYW